MMGYALGFGPNHNCVQPLGILLHDHMLLLYLVLHTSCHRRPCLGFLRQREWFSAECTLMHVRTPESRYDCSGRDLGAFLT
jgi:hypothetical protein